VGRRRPLARLKELLLEPGPRLVTLTGPGGTGKTRLALEAALQLAEAFGDGVCFVDLATLRDPERVAPAIARALGVPETAGQPVIESLKAALDGRRMLLVLDNFEQVVEGAPAAALLLEACPDLAVLATSRELLRLRGEHVFPVPALALPAETAAPAPEELARYGAVRLFVERARAVRADFRLTRENASAVAGICARLEGLPLSIELAAARIELLSPQALLEHLERPLELLTGGARDLPPRPQTLRSALAWSYELLDEGERSLFERLSAFVGGCTLDAAQAVSAAGGGAGIDVLDGASSLIGKSLLRRSSPAASTTPDEEPRLEMLETIRQFGVERLAASGQERAARDAHAAFFLALAEAGAVALAAGDRAPWLRRLEAEHDNLRAALDWTAGDGHDPATELRLAGALGRFWSFHSHLTEGRARLDGALRRAVSLGPTAERAKALAGAGGLATVQGDWDAARLAYAEALAAWRNLGDRRGVAEALLASGAMEVWCGRTEVGRGHLGESLALWEELADERGTALALYRLGEAAFLAREYDEARPRLEKSAEMLRGIGDAWALALPLSYLGEIARMAGDYATATALYEEGLAVNRELGTRWSESLLLHNLGHVALRQGDLPRARSLFRESLTLARDVGVKRGIALCLAGLAGVAVTDGDAAVAARLLGAAEVLLESTGHRLNPADGAEFDRFASMVRDRLTPDALAAAWHEGRLGRLERTITEAAGT
jgi:predicted ATPase